MKNSKKTPFFVKLKNAIFNFDKYQSFAEEKTSQAIKYFFKLMLLFATITAIIAIINFSQIMNKGKQVLKEEIPEFKFEENTLVVEGEEKEFIKGDGQGYLCVVINSEKENLSEIENTGYENVVAFLKDRVTIKNIQGLERSISYENIDARYKLSNINKETIEQFLDNKVIYLIVFAISFVAFYITYTISIAIDILLLSVIGFLISRIINVRFKYKVIVNLSIYSLSLSIILYLIYIGVNAFTGFTVRYFEMAYNIIGYIYIITAMLMIKSDLIKQQIELAKVIEEQRKIRIEKDQEDNQEEQKDKEKKDNKDQADKKENKKDNNEENKEQPAPAEE